MIYSIIGWIWETPYVSFNEKKYVNRGFLKGPYIPNCKMHDNVDKQNLINFFTNIFKA